jgi:Lar family restriction alleviation protein
MSEELKKCPFCGGSDIRYSNKTKGDSQNYVEDIYGRRKVSMYCNACKVYGPRLIVDGLSFNGSKKEGLAEAIAAWNTRDTTLFDEMVTALEYYADVLRVRCRMKDCDNGEIAKAILTKAKKG